MTQVRQVATGQAVATSDRCLECVPGGSLTPVYNPAYTAAYALDPYFAKIEDEAGRQHCTAPALEATHMIAARQLVQRVGGDATEKQFARLFTQVYPSIMQPFVASIAEARSKSPKEIMEGCERNLEYLCLQARSGAVSGKDLVMRSLR